MTSHCEQELCPNWNGDLCLCAAMAGDPDALAQLDTWLDDMEAIILDETV